MNTLEKVLQLIDEERKKSSLSDIALDKAIGLKRSSIANWRLGRGTPSTDALVKIAAYFHVSADYLLGLTDETTPYPPSVLLQKEKTTENIEAATDIVEPMPESDTLQIDTRLSDTPPLTVTQYNITKDDPEKLPDNLTAIPYNEVIIFPVIGTIAAGYNGLAEYNPTGEEIPVPSYLLKSHNADDYFVLHVKGLSMSPIYNDGDKVLIRKCSSVASGTVAAVGYDEEEATLKKVEYVKGEDWMKLIPLNPDFPTKIIRNGDLELCRIYGELVYSFSDNNKTLLGIDQQLARKLSSLTNEQKLQLLMLIDKLTK